MTLKELKVKVLSLIEELNLQNELLTNDKDISAKINDVINQVMFELCRYKKIAKYVEFDVVKGELIDFARLERECGYEIYQVQLVSGVDYEMRANGTVFKILESGNVEADLFVYPERITSNTKDNYEFELSADVLEIAPYGIAADLLSSDASSDSYRIYRDRYQSLLNTLDTRNMMPSITFEGGVLI